MENLLSNLLFESHKVSSLSNPIIVHEFKLSRITTIPCQVELTKKAFKEFKKSESKYTTVDHDPKWWTALVIKHVKSALEFNQEIVKLPNGCCNSEDCPLKAYYVEVMALLSSSPV